MVHYSFNFTAYKAASGESCLRCGTAKSFTESTHIVFLGQQKSSPQLPKNKWVILRTHLNPHSNSHSVYVSTPDWILTLSYESTTYTWKCWNLIKSWHIDVNLGVGWSVLNITLRVRLFWVKWFQEIIFPQICMFGCHGKWYFPENDFRLTNIFTFDPKMILHPHFPFKSFPEKEREREREREKREPRSEREKRA